ncbi:CpXC domain-containing protein [Spirochaetota bacterium]
MTNSTSLEFKCPDCGNKQEIQYWDSLDVSVDGEMRDKFLKNEINFYNCAKCGLFIPLDLGMVYHDAERKYMIYFENFKSNDKIKDKFNSLSDSLKDDEMKKIVKEGYRLRIVLSRFHAQEKIRILDAGLDDMQVEIFKINLRYFMEREKGIKALAVMFKGYDEINSDTMQFNVYDENEEAHLFSTSFAKQYSEIKKQYAQKLKESQKADPQWLIVDGNYVLEKFIK